MGSAQIVGIFLIRNEDLFIERAVRNVIPFCDRVIVADNFSTDRTWDIVCGLSREDSRVECHRIPKTGDSHTLVQPYAGTATWAFGVDGDEIYDPARLLEFKKDLLAGRYDDWWVIFGNVLNCVRLDEENKTAAGYLSPPGRSMTKLYNFRAITRWDGPCSERMFGGHPVFNPGYDLSRRLNLHEKFPWEDSAFRCLHTCFLRRSSRDPADRSDRPNPAELAARDRWDQIGLGFLKKIRGRRNHNWKNEKYRRGDLVRMDVSSFFPE